MLTLKLIKEQTEEVIKGLEKKHFNNAREAINKVIEVDKARRAAQNELDKNLAQAKTLSMSIGALMKEGRADEAERARAEVAAMKETNKSLEAAMTEAEAQLTTLLCSIPNVPNSSVPEGSDAVDNVVERQGGHIPQLGPGALPHWELAKKYDLIDFELGVKIQGLVSPSTKARGRGCRER